MPDAVQYVQARRVRRVAVTIPANAGAADTLENLVVAALNVIQAGLGDAERKNMIGGQINAVATNYIVGDTASSLPLTITAGDVYSEPSCDFLSATYVKSSAGAIAGAVVSIALAGAAPEI